jgi:hypothetical protein
MSGKYYRAGYYALPPRRAFAYRSSPSRRCIPTSLSREAGGVATSRRTACHIWEGQYSGIGEHALQQHTSEGLVAISVEPRVQKSQRRSSRSDESIVD